MARPTKFTPDTQKRILQGIQLGATYELAAQYGGISYATLNNWMNKGEAAKTGAYFEFFNAIKEAEGKGAIGWLAKIETAANEGSWQAAAWKLERRYPDKYGKTVKDVNHGNQEGKPLEILIQYATNTDDTETS